MSSTVEIRDPGDPQRYRVRCVHLPSDIGELELAYWNDGTVTLQGVDQLVLVTGVENWSDGFHVSLAFRESPQFKLDKTHEWRDGICHTVTPERTKLRRKAG